MRRALGITALLALVAGCTEPVTPAGVVPTKAADYRPAAFDEMAEAQRLTRACIRAELEGVNALASLAGDGYAYFKGAGDAVFIKVAPKSRPLAMVHDIGLRKANADRPCTIHVRPYTHGAAVLAVAKAEMAAQGWQQVPAQKGRADWYAKDGQTISLLGWVPGGQARWGTGAEISFRRVTP